MRRLAEATDKDGGVAPFTKQVVNVRTAVEMLQTYYVRMMIVSR
jgi:hypothetical protein